jgi:hypothetical protein
MNIELPSDFVAGFLFGSLVTQSANGLERKLMNMMPNIRKCLEDVVAGDITLVDSPEEIAPELGPVPDAYKSQADSILRERLRTVREAHKESAARVLEELRTRGLL